MFRKHIKTVFDLRLDEMRVKLQEACVYLYAIIESDDFIEISTKIPVPAGATKRDVENLLKEYAPKKMKSIIDFILVKQYDNAVNMFAILFNTDVEKFKKKSLNDIARDFSRISKESMRGMINFFTHAGH